MAKLRKMMGDLEDPSIKGLMSIIETQSKNTLGSFSIHYVQEHYLPIYENSTDDYSFRSIIEACEKFLNKEIKLAELKPYLKEGQNLARALDNNPLGQAAARAISTACGVLTTPTNALGFTFYGAACIAYHQVGLEASAEVYDNLASIELEHIYNCLKEVAIENESNPVKIKWNC